MNENVFYQKADYTQNQNLIFEDNTVYEVDPKCMGQKKGNEEKDRVVRIVDALDCAENQSRLEQTSACCWWFWLAVLFFVARRK